MATIISTMAAEGRELKTPAEVLQVTMPMPTNAEIAADLGAWGPHPAPTSTSTSSGTGHHATAVAPHTPPKLHYEFYRPQLVAYLARPRTPHLPHTYLVPPQAPT